MKALVYKGPRELELQEVPDPVPGDGEVLIRVEACGICGSDMHAWAGHDERRPPPLVLGHEAVGTIVEGPKSGTRVAVNPLVVCGTCDCCLGGRTNLCAARQIISMPPRAGAFAELLAMPLKNVIELPPGIPAETAVLAEPIACGWHAVGRAERALDRPLATARCLVLGGGAIGLGAATVLAARGAAEISIAETNAKRMSVLEATGPFTVFDPASEAGPTAPDIVIDAYGSEATRMAASAAVRPGGVIVHIGLAGATGGLDIRRMTLQEIAFIGTYTYTQVDFRETLAAIIAGRLGALDWVESRPLDSGARSFDDLARGEVPAPKIALRPATD